MSGRRPWPSLPAIHTIAFDFDGVFTDNAVWVGRDGAELVRCDRRDGLGVDLLRAALARGMLQAEVFILSKERHPVVEARAHKLRLSCHSGCDDKFEFVRDHLARRRGDAADPFAGLVYLGNDLNDLSLMERAGFSVAPEDAHPRVRAVAAVVLPHRGGDGFVRAFVEQLLDVQNMTSGELNELVHHR